ncbi:DUF1868 domain-containing protein [Oxynema aestuarii]|nr:DUF1868 domain-containing protein [Oxynema aestuarii]
MDDTLQLYLNRVARMTLLESYLGVLQHIQTSPKYKPSEDGTRQAVPFPGYTIVAPPWADDRQNEAFYQDLQQYQQELLTQMGEGLAVAVPPPSFHVTLADLIWNDAFRDAAAKSADYEAKLRSAIAESFAQCDTLKSPEPIRWEVLGAIVMTRAIGVCLVPKDEQSYDRVVQLRRAIYQNKNLMGLGVEQQYHLTAHVTLGYFGEIPKDLDRHRLAVMLSEFNNRWLECDRELVITRAELRQFADMTAYTREPDWPTLDFV